MRWIWQSLSMPFGSMQGMPLPSASDLTIPARRKTSIISGCIPLSLDAPSRSVTSAFRIVQISW
jgi:hypothetical protein